MISEEQAARLGEIFNINFDVVPFAQWHYGLNVELEHGLRAKKFNVTSDSPYQTARITIVHLIEAPDYYARLRRLERAAEEKWGGHKPSIFRRGR